MQRRVLAVFGGAGDDARGNRAAHTGVMIPEVVYLTGIQRVTIGHIASEEYLWGYAPKLT